MQTLRARFGATRLPAPPLLSRAMYAVVVAHTIPRRTNRKMNCPAAFILPNFKLKRLRENSQLLS